jgi:hypothetical protein
VRLKVEGMCLMGFRKSGGGQGDRCFYSFLAYGRNEGDEASEQRRKETERGPVQG